MIAAIAEIVTLTGVAASVLLGAMIGALYGYALDPHHRPIYPVQLWIVGIAFIVTIALVTGLSDDPIAPVAFSIGRGILWTVTCLAIPAGRWGRMSFEEWRLRRKANR